MVRAPAALPALLAVGRRGARAREPCDTGVKSTVDHLAAAVIDHVAHGLTLEDAYADHDADFRGDGERRARLFGATRDRHWTDLVDPDLCLTDGGKAVALAVRRRGGRRRRRRAVGVAGQPPDPGATARCSRASPRCSASPRCRTSKA